MATSCRKTHQIAAVVFFLVVFTASSSLSSARLLNGFVSHGLAASEPALNLALPVEGHENDVSEKSEQDPKPQVLPCDHMVPIKNSHVGILRSPTQRLTGKYGPTILSRLPKGPTPPSGPSKGTNDVKN